MLIPNKLTLCINTSFDLSLMTIFQNLIIIYHCMKIYENKNKRIQFFYGFVLVKLFYK